MGETTGISWTDATFNPWIGCRKVSPGCAHCYAERDNRRYHWVDAWNGPRKRTSPANWQKPEKWDAEARRSGTPRRVFCASLADVFDPEVPQDWRLDLWKLIAGCDALEWLILTKRPENIAAMLPTAWLKSPPAWIRLGVTVESQSYTFRLIDLLQAWRGKNFVSYEPALGPVDFYPFLTESPEDCSAFCPPDAHIHWLIAGCESGSDRITQADWLRAARDQCQEAHVPFFLKQMVIDGKLTKTPALDGKIWTEFPEVEK